MADPIEPGRSPLDQLQRWMLRAVTHEDGLQAGLAAARAEGLWPEGARTLSDIVPGNDRLTPEEQLQIYAYAYFARLHDVLASELPATAHLLGDEAFASMLRAFLRDHPSATYTLDRVSEPLPAWLEAQGEPLWAAAADIVRVERGMDSAFDAPPSGRADADALAALPPDAWATARLHFVPALRLLSLEHDVIPAMEAARQGMPADAPERRAAWVAVYRTNFRRRRSPLSRPQFLLLQALVDGACLGEALEALALGGEVALDELLPQIGGWFQQWVAEGWVAEITTPRG